MRFLLAALALVACHRAPTSTAPTNKAPTPDYQATATDELAFLAIDADMVVGINFIELRKSQMWASFKPQIDGMMKQLDQQFGSCGTDLPQTLEGVTLAVKLVDSNRIDGIIVMHGAEVAKAVDCGIADVRKQGGQVTVDRGVTITQSKGTNTKAGMMVIGGSTVVMQLHPQASHDTLVGVLDKGVPLRQSAAFMKMYNRRERGAAVWGMANGNASLFEEFGNLRPRGLDGTMIVTDRLKVAMRVAMTNPGDAAQVQRELDKVKPQLAAFVDRFDAQTAGEMVNIDVEMTEGQIRGLFAMLRGVGP